MLSSSFMNRHARSGLTLLLAATIAGCSGPGGNDPAMRGRDDAIARIDKAQSSIVNDAPALSGIKSVSGPANVSVHEGLFLADEGYRVSTGEPLPARFETKDGISVSYARPITVDEFARDIEELTGIQVDYSDLAATPLFEAGAGSTDPAAGLSSDSATPPSPTAGGDVVSDGDNSSAFSSPIDRTFQVRFTGPLSDLLDKVAARLGVDWSYRAGRIYLLGPQTVTYTLWALPSTLKANASVGGDSEGVIFGGSAPASVSYNAETNYWDSIEAGIRAIIPNGGGAYSINKASGTIVVTGPRFLQARVRDFVERENARLSRQVAIRLDVVAFTRSRSDAKSTDIQALLNQLSNGYRLDMQSPVNAIDGSTSLMASVLSGPASGSAAAIRALSSVGKVSLLTSTSVVASNNTPTPVNITNDRAYLAGITTSSTDTGSEATEIQTGIVRSGLNAVVTPRILSSGDILLNYTLNVTDVKDIQEFSSPDGSTAVQLPNIDTRNFMQTVNMHSGESLVIASFTQESTRDSSAGPFDPRFWGLGGKSEYSMEDTQVLILMTPVEVTSRNKPQGR